MVQSFPSVDPLAEKYTAWTPYHYVHGNPIRFTDPTGMKADSAYTVDVNTGVYTTVGDTGGNEFDVITPVVTNTDGSQTVAGDTYVDDFIGFHDPQRGNPYITASGALQTLDGGDDPFFVLFTLGLGAGMKGAGAADDIASLGFAKHPDYNSAWKAALEWLKKRGFKAEKVNKGKFGNTKGKGVGMTTKDKKTGFRVEHDKRSGGHINVFSGKEKGPHIKFEGSESTVKKIQRRFQRLFSKK